MPKLWLGNFKDCFGFVDYAPRPKQSIIPLRLRDDLTTFLLIIAAIGIAGLIWVRG